MIHSRNKKKTKLLNGKKKVKLIDKKKVDLGVGKKKVKLDGEAAKAWILKNREYVEKELGIKVGKNITKSDANKMVNKLLRKL